MQHLRTFAIATTLAAGSAGAASGQELLRLSTLGAGTSPYLVMSTFANVVSEELETVEIGVNATGAATRHALEAARGETDFIMSSPNVHYFMSEGLAMYEPVGDAPELAQELRSLFAFPLGPYHIVTYADSGIERLEDLEGKRVFLGPPGGAALTTAGQFVNAATGLEPDEDFDVVQLGWDAAAQSFQDGQLDVYINPTLAPSPVIEQIAFARPIRLLGFTEEQLDREEMEGPLNRLGATLDVIAADAYGSNQVNETEVTTIGSNVSIAVGNHLSEEIVYDVMRAFWDRIDEIHQAQPWMQQVTLDGAFVDLNMPLHAGALRFYDEMGIEVPEDLRGDG